MYIICKSQRQNKIKKKKLQTKQKQFIVHFFFYFCVFKGEKKDEGMEMKRN